MGGEEAGEFFASGNDPGELVGIHEVRHALAGQAGTDRRQPEKLSAAKAEEGGSFCRPGYLDRKAFSGVSIQA